MDFDKVLKKTNYTPTQLRKRIEDTFKAAGKKLGEVGKTDFFNDPRRKTALFEDIGRAKEEFKELRLYSPDDSLIRFEVSCAVNFNTLEDQLNYSIAAAIWILDELRRAGKLYEAYEYLPTDRMAVSDEFLPMDFYHPCYEYDLIQSVLYVINPRRNEYDNFRKLMALIPSEKIETAVEKFRGLRWEAVHRYLRCEEVFDRRNEKITLELKALATPNILMVNREDDPARERELAEEGFRSEDDRRDLEVDFEGYLGTTEKRPFESRELGRILNNFPIDNPYEICFAASYLLNVMDDILWSTKSCVAVLSAAGRLLPWYISDWDDEDYWEPMSFDLNTDWLERSSPDPDLEKLFKPGADGLNMSQRIYKQCRGVLPVGFHPFEGEGTEAAELLFLSNFRARAANLRSTNHWLEEDDEDEALPESAESPITLGGYWGKETPHLRIR